MPFVRHVKLASDVTEMFRQEGMSDKVQLLETSSELYAAYYCLDGFIDSYYGDLVPSTGYLRVFDLQKYKNGMLLLPPDFAGDCRVPAKMIPQEKNCLRLLPITFASMASSG